MSPRGRMILSSWLLCGALAICGCSSLPEPSRLHFDAGRKARLSGDLPEALRRYSLAVEIAGEQFYPEARLERGECLLELAEVETDGEERAAHLAAALVDFEAVAGRADSSVLEMAQALDGMGRAYRERKDPEAAARYFEELLRMDLLETSGQLLAYRLKAHRQLGWIHLEPALERLARQPPSAAQEAGEGDGALLAAQEHFSLGLEISPGDPLCNLGKGLCLHLRGQHKSAVDFLERALAHESSASWGPEGPYCLARALEEAAGYQRVAFDRYEDALRRDADRDFLPLYSHLLAVLPVYVSPVDPSFRSYVSRLLEYRGEDPSHWSRVAQLGSELTDSELPNVAELGYEALAIASTRTADFAAAAESLLALREHPDFLELVDATFPDADPLDPGHAFGRARTLFEAGRHGELEEWFSEGEGSQVEPQLASDPSPRAASLLRQSLVIRGKNLASLWNQEQRSRERNPLDEGPEDTSRLILARNIFQECLSLKRDDPEARRGLAVALGNLGAFDGALSHYEILAARDPADADTFRHLRDLYERLPTQEERARAWTLLRKYSGDDPELGGYVERTRKEISARVALFCRGCGRMNPRAETYCLECGRPLGEVRETREP